MKRCLDGIYALSDLIAVRREMEGIQVSFLWLPRGGPSLWG